MSTIFLKYNSSDLCLIKIIEHQTLTRLPRSNYILFTIHTFHSPLKEEASDKQRARTMLSFLKGVPEDLLDYKIITPFYTPLLEYLIEAV